MNRIYGDKRELFSLTPKALANFSPTLGAQRQPWERFRNHDLTLKALGATNPFRV
jgi:hypothetical protein